MSFTLGFLLGATAAGGALGLVLWRARSSLQEATTRLAVEREAQKGALALAKRVFDDKIDQVTGQATSFLREATKAQLDAAQTSADSQFSLRTRAIDDLVRPVAEMLGDLRGQMDSAREARAAEMAAMTSSIGALTDAERSLHVQTASLEAALRSNSARGRWGEVQLRRVIELAGMERNCDFVEQAMVAEGDHRLRPDVIVHLPEHRSVPIDAKVPLDAFLRAAEATDDRERKRLLAEHASQLRQHVRLLSSKAYWAGLNEAEFVIAFIPSDALLAAAAESDAAIFEDAVSKRVLLATPSSLIALLRSCAFSWSQKDMVDHAAEILKTGSELYERLSVLVRHLARHAKTLNQSVSSFNDVVGSFDRRVAPSARRMHEMGVGADELVDLPASDVVALQPNAPAIVPAAGSREDDPEAAGGGGVPRSAGIGW